MKDIKDFLNKIPKDILYTGGLLLGAGLFSSIGLVLPALILGLIGGYMLIKNLLK